jgi:alkylation response protein AidB-like acyl-CoA dehydrogenase
MQSISILPQIELPKTPPSGPTAPPARPRALPRATDPVVLAELLCPDFADRAEKHDREASFPLENYAAMREAGLMKLAIPRELGGFGGGLPEMTRVLEALGAACPATALAFTMHTAVSGQFAHMWHLERDGQWGPWLKRWCDGRMAIGGALSEKNSWNGVIFPQSLATRVPGGWVLNGSRGFCTGSVAIDQLQITAQYVDPEGQQRGLYAIISPDAPGLTIQRDWDAMGMRGSASNSVRLDAVFVPDAAVIYEYPYGLPDTSEIWISFLVWSFLGFASVYLGIAKRARDLALETIKDRTRAPSPFPLAHKSSNIIRAGEMEVALAAMRSLAHHTADTYATKHPMGIEALIAAAAAKQFIVTKAIEVVDRALTVVGGQAMHRKYAFERLWRDVRAGPFHPFSAEDTLEMLGKLAFGLAPLGPTGWAL